MRGLNDKILNSRILIVDDTALNRDLLQAYLNGAGFMNIFSAEDGVEALEQITQNEPDILILDLIMPRMDGFDVCERLAKINQCGFPILVQTASGGSAERTRAFEAGATDFITKPIHRTELLTRVRLHLEKRALIARLQQYSDRVANELGDAQAMQLSLLPTDQQLAKVRKLQKLDVGAAFETSSEVGGDLWGIRSVSSSRISLYSFDVCGHGLTAALDAFRLHALISAVVVEEDSPAVALGKLSDRLRELLPPGRYATMLLVSLDLKSDRLRYASAAAPGLVVQVPGRGAAFLNTSGLPLAVADGQVYASRNLAFPPGASLYMFSDAVIETPDEDGYYWDNPDMLTAVIESQKQQTAQDAIEFLIKRFRARRQPFLADDLTMVCARRL